MKLKVKHKLILLTCIPIFITIFFITIMFHSSNVLIKNTEDVISKRLLPIIQLNEIVTLYSTNIVDLAHKTRAQMLLWSEADEQIKSAQKTLQISWQQYLSSELSEQEKILIEGNQGAFESAQNTILKLQGFIEAQSSYAMSDFVDLELYSGIEPITTLLKALIKQQKIIADETLQEAQQYSATIKQWLGIIAISVALVALMLGWWLVWGVNRRLDKMLNIITQIESSNNLSLQLDMPQGDEFGDIGRRFDRMIRSFAVIIESIQENSAHLATESQQLVAINRSNEAQLLAQQVELQSTISSVDSLNEASLLH
ncbi:methyl-accepting chemotaxis protein [Psychromonas sp. MME2]|uniref:methyl-accepting chemotaxis protein n=1 Tax=unclassified Psychromonas TaxID=2614957 RepID=UPI00339C0955